jgi:hypothetical protein
MNNNAQPVDSIRRCIGENGCGSDSRYHIHVNYQRADERIVHPCHGELSETTSGKVLEVTFTNGTNCAHYPEGINAAD